MTYVTNRVLPCPTFFFSLFTFLSLIFVIFALLLVFISVLSTPLCFLSSSYSLLSFACCFLQFFLLLFHSPIFLLFFILLLVAVFVFFFFLYVFCFISTFSFSSLICVLQHLLVIHVLLFSLRLDQLFLPVYYLLFLFIFLLQKPRDTLVMFQLEAEEGQDLKLHKHTKN